MENLDKTAMRKMLIEARKFSALSPDDRIVVSIDSKVKAPYAFWGRHAPESIRSGADSIVCEFCLCLREPEDGSYLQKLLSYADLADEERAAIVQKWADGELSIEEIEWMVLKDGR